MPWCKPYQFTGFAPNLTPRDTKRALQYLFFPWKWAAWKNGPYPLQVEEELKKIFDVRHAAAFDSGRSALGIALQALGVKKGDEVLVQAYTCVVVANAIRWAGAVPVYVDIDDRFGMDPEDAQKKITKKTKAVIIQHTFGIPADTQSLIALAKTHGLGTVEDCAHAFGVRADGALLGTAADIGMLSFGSDKPLSCVRGGALITKSEALGARINAAQQRLGHMPLFAIKKHLLHFPFFAIGKRWYGCGIGKWLLAFAKQARLIARIMTQSEKRGAVQKIIPARMPNALAHVLLGQIEECETINEHRKKVVAVYKQHLQKKHAMPALPLLRYPLLVDDPELLQAHAKKSRVLLGDWYRHPIAPSDSDAHAAGYISGSCPRAESAARMSINLPTDRNITLDDARAIAALVNSWYDTVSH